MSQAGAPGPEVDTKEDLYRCLTTPDWWVAEEKRPSSAAFKQPDFSADVASLAGSPQYTLERFPAECGLVAFNHGDAKEIGFIARLEPDRTIPTTKRTRTSTTRTPRRSGKRWRRSSSRRSSREAAFWLNRYSPLDRQPATTDRRRLRPGWRAAAHRARQRFRVADPQANRRSPVVDRGGQRSDAALPEGEGRSGRPATR
jgi:hypothetical protein